MPDVEKVIKGLETERVINGLKSVVADMQEEVDEWRDYSDSELRRGLTCDCEWWYETLSKVQDALALLKEQQTELTNFRKWWRNQWDK